MPREDLTGRVFGRLTVIGYSHTAKHHNVVWRCRCECGGESLVRAGNLRSGNTKSCGCGETEYRNGPPANKTHGMSGTTLEDTYYNMRKRCYYPGFRDYGHYGGRGIRVCEEWLTNPAAFYEWAKPRWRPGLTLDRRDVDGNYEPSNCRFVDLIAQANNKTNNLVLEWRGDIKTVSEWAIEVGISRDTLYQRVVTLGWSDERALTEPVRGSA